MKRSSQRRIGCTAIVRTSARNAGPTSELDAFTPARITMAAAKPISTSRPRGRPVLPREVAAGGLSGDVVTFLLAGLPGGTRPQPCSPLSAEPGLTRLG